MKLIEDLGMLYPTEKSKHKARYGLYQCPNCLKPFSTMTTMVKQGKSTQCRSCQVATKNTTHGLRSHALYSTWKSMMDRCYNPNHISYPSYGKRGITVESALQHIEQYIRYVETLPKLPKQVTIDRINNSKNYVKGNLRWADWVTQNTNQRKKKTSRFDYIGVCQRSGCKDYSYRIRVGDKRIISKGYPTQKDAAKARDAYIKANNLPHRLTGVT